MRTYPDLPSGQVFKLVQWVLDPKVINGALKSAIETHGPITGVLAGQLYWSNQPKLYPELTLKNLLKKWLGIPHSGQDYAIVTLAAPITTCGTSSASKRIRGAMRTRLEEFFKDLGEKNSEESV